MGNFYWASPTYSRNSGGLRLDTNRLNTSHSQRLNSGKPLGTGRCSWWCPIDPCPNEPLPRNSRPSNVNGNAELNCRKINNSTDGRERAYRSCRNSVIPRIFPIRGKSADTGEQPAVLARRRYSARFVTSERKRRWERLTQYNKKINNNYISDIQDRQTVL